jgi:UDP-N-acetylglucosamine acyltransferase
LIDPAARISPAARLADNVEVGPFSIIGDDVVVESGTRIGPHVIINGPTHIGPDCRISQFCSIGDAPQDKKYAGEKTRLEIGARNVIRESCTLNRGTVGGGGVTRIGDDNWIMAYVHVAHDCVVGSDITMANGTTLAGHVEVDDHVIFGAFTVIHQFCIIGAHCFSAMGTVILKDVPPYVTVSGNSAVPHGINSEGLKRRGFSKEAIMALRRAYKMLYKRGNTVAQARELLLEQAATVPEVLPLVQFLSRSTRGIVR